jgi:DNA mismatch repair protein MutH
LTVKLAADKTILDVVQLAARTVTVFALDTKALKLIPATTAGAPTDTTFPSAAPVTVIVKSLVEFALTVAKSKDAAVV